MAKVRAKGILACDVGNSRTALGCVVDEEASPVRRVGSDDSAAMAEALADVWEQTPAPKLLVACSVNPSGLERLKSAARKIAQDVLVVGTDLPLPMETALPHPEQIGTDRLCTAAVAYHRLGQAVVVADFGTAVTIDCVSPDGVFLGGAILPGLAPGAESLAARTAYLPKIELTRPDWVFGRDTRQAVVGGIVYGARGALRELTEAYATELGQWPSVILTGGDAELVGADCKFVHAVVPDLCLAGVALAYRLAEAELP